MTPLPIGNRIEQLLDLFLNLCMKRGDVVVDICHSCVNNHVGFTFVGALARSPKSARAGLVELKKRTSLEPATWRAYSLGKHPPVAVCVGQNNPVAAAGSGVAVKLRPLAKPRVDGDL